VVGFLVWKFARVGSVGGTTQPSWPTSSARACVSVGRAIPSQFPARMTRPDTARRAPIPNETSAVDGRRLLACLPAADAAAVVRIESRTQYVGRHMADIACPFPPLLLLLVEPNSSPSARVVVRRDVLGKLVIGHVTSTSYVTF
jgi:hypothetical protein